MRLMRIGAPGAERPCVLDSDGTPRDVSALVADFGPQTAATLSEVLNGIDLAGLPPVDAADQRIGPPVAPPKNIWCIGQNYVDHAKEMGSPTPEQPFVFNKAACAYCGPNDPIFYASHMSKLDWEVELGVVIGTPALGVSEENALGHVLGYCTADDVSERVWQNDRGGQFVKGKSYPNFCPVGPQLVTADEIADPQTLRLSLDVNGTRMQDGTTADMIFSVATLIAHISEFARLEAGDLILTGTPAGVGGGRSPPVFLKPGDQVSLEVEGLGKQEHLVTAI